MSAEMTLLMSALLALSFGGAASLALGSRRLARKVGPVSTVVGCLLGLVSAVFSLGGSVEFLSMPWNVPFGSFRVGMDALSAFFLLPVFGLGALGAVYGYGYLQTSEHGKSHGFLWFFYNFLIASMALVVVARNAVLFLVAWEIMSLTAYFLVTAEDSKPEARQAGWTYLVATHLGTVFIMFLFLLLGNGMATLDFGVLSASTPRQAGLVFILALVGFGAKAGFVPFHVWLPEAHPAAPSHVSAVMSGVMIKMGIYGLIRVLIFLGEPPVWWGWVLIGVGLVSGVMGVLFALAQHDLKRLLAYHSVENIGIITMGIGLGVLGMSLHSPVLTVLGWAGGLLHVVNHALFKGLLFFGAGSVLRATGSRDLDHLGGLLKPMPITGATFLIGAAAISGLPPLNGFVSEFLVFTGSLRGGVFLGPQAALPSFAILAGLGLIGGLAVACFAKVFGMVFLGEPRAEKAPKTVESNKWMTSPMILAALGCLTVGLGAPIWVGGMMPVLRTLGIQSEAPLQDSVGALWVFTGAAGILLGLIVLLVFVRRSLFRGRRVEKSGTWDCGYLKPTPRMQYSASSFADPLVRLFASLLRTQRRVQPLQGLFPSQVLFSTETPDVFKERFFAPLFRGVAGGLSKFRWLQAGRVHLYVLYIALTLLALFLWRLP